MSDTIGLRRPRLEEPVTLDNKNRIVAAVERAKRSARKADTLLLGVDWRQLTNREAMTILDSVATHFGAAEFAIDSLELS